jgi:hypothetical protein
MSNAERRPGSLVLAVLGLALSAGAGCADDGSGRATEQEALELSCPAYCTHIRSVCTDANQQYINEQTCLAACATWPVGREGDETGDSLACRLHHVAEITDPTSMEAADHCSHTGPAGDGVCGSNCEGYCDLVQASCTGGDRLYADRATCLAACRATPDDLVFTTAVRSGPHVACLVAHAELAASAPAEQCGELVADCR